MYHLECAFYPQLALKETLWCGISGSHHWMDTRIGMNLEIGGPYMCGKLHHHWASTVAWGSPYVLFRICVLLTTDLKRHIIVWNQWVGPSKTHYGVESVVPSSNSHQNLYKGVSTYG